MKRLLIAAAILAMLATAHARPRAYSIGQTDQVTKGLVAYWSMRNSGTTVLDEIGANNGGASNGVVFSYANGLVGGGGYFDGASTYVEINDSDALSFGSGASIAPFTIAAWVRVEEASHAETLRIVAKNGTNISDSARTEYKLEVMADNKIRLYLRDESVGKFSIRSSASSLITNAWQFIVATKGALSDASTHQDIYVYLSGVDVTDPASGTTEAGFVAMENTSAKLRLGATAHATDSRALRGYVKGGLDEVRIYNRVLTADEIKQLCRMGATIFQNR
jgi:hypothetical protein